MKFDYAVVETDNYDGDYPDESFVCEEKLCKSSAKGLAEVLNQRLGGPTAKRFWKVVELPYTLRPSFEASGEY